ncbi:MAG: ISAzo13 family transposase, partial [Candidatus Sulfotelmatobacter sp.]
RDYETVVNLIAETTTAKGLTVTCRLDRRKYPTGRKVTAEEMKKVNVQVSWRMELRHQASPSA